MARGGAAALLRAYLVSLSVSAALGFSATPGPSSSVGAARLRAGAAGRSPLVRGPASRGAHGPRRHAPPALCMESKNGGSDGELDWGALGALLEGGDRPDQGRRLVSTVGPLALLSVGFPGLGEGGDSDAVDKAVGVLRKQCAPYIAAVQASGGRLLYRGGGPPDGPQVAVMEASDLLEDKTYGEVGAAYFANVEIWAEQNSAKGAAPLPSEGHIAVSNVEEAARWGAPHSCWPVGPLKYLWLAESRLLYTDAWPEAEAKSWPMPTSDMDAFLRGKGVKVNTGLEEALAKGHEVLFVSQGYYLIPAAWEEKLQEALQLSTRPKQNPT